MTELPQSAVLNAFRHQRKDHAPSIVMTDRMPSSAQRLSASTEGSHRSARLLDASEPVECSTPFGIKGNVHFLNKRVMLHSQRHEALGQLKDFSRQPPGGGKRR